MSKEHFTTVLGNVSRAGVYQLPQHGVADLRAAAKDGGLAQFRVRLEGVQTKEGFLAAVAQALDFPDWFGHNWDALEDCLTDMSWQPADGYLVILSRAQDFRRAQEEEFAMALRIFDAAADFWREEGVPFWTLVDLHADDMTHLPELP
jgi:RNAse (barnase) inhibitor barstar